MPENPKKFNLFLHKNFTKMQISVAKNYKGDTSPRGHGKIFNKNYSEINFSFLKTLKNMF
jgi:hypothetical protein